MKILNIVFILFFILIINNNLIESKKLYTIKYYEFPNCTGTIILYQTLLSTKAYQFQLTAISDLFLFNCTGDFENSTAPCYVEGYGDCSTNPNNCRKYLEINKCDVFDGNGRMLVLETLNYLEKDYCVCTETIRNHNFIDGEIVWEAVQVIRKNFCHIGMTLYCDYFKFELTECDTGKIKFKSASSEMFMGTSLLAPEILVTYKPNDPNYYLYTVVSNRKPKKEIFYYDMLKSDQIRFINHNLPS